MQAQNNKFFDAFLALKSHEEVIAFLTDILSETELERLKDRWAAHELLADGLSQTEVSEKSGLSRVTVGRAARVLRGGTGMIQIILERLNN